MDDLNPVKIEVAGDGTISLIDKIDILYSRLTIAEAKVAALEADRDRFLAALKGAAEMCLKNPVVVSMMPRDMKDQLKAYIGAS